MEQLSSLIKPAQPDSQSKDNLKNEEMLYKVASVDSEASTNMNSRT
jgi:hypothetical protein